VSTKEEPKARLAQLQKVQSWCLKSEDARKINAMLDLARSEPGVSVLPGDLDRDPWLLNCNNGTLDLRTGELRPHSRDDLLTKLCPTDYLPDAPAPLWGGTLARIFEGNEAIVGYLQRLAGYALTGDVREAVLPIHWGCGSNGKSLLFEVLLYVLGGDYACAGAKELLLSDRFGERHPTHLADLFGRRLVLLSELPEGGRLNEAMAKQLTGRDRIKARRMREDYWQFDPTHKIWVATNHKPKVGGTDHAIWRRLRLIPYHTRFWDADRGESGPPELRADKALPAKLRAEAPGILAWAVRGCLDWQKNGLQEPRDVLMATGQYRDEQDVVAAFLLECCCQGQEHSERSSALYAAYQRWFKDSGEGGEQLSHRRFGEELASRDFRKRVSNGTWYDGLCLLSSIHPEED
jgi:putative DNA primase/helicase